MKPEKNEPLSGEDAKAYFEAIIAAILAAAGAGVAGCKIQMSWLNATKICCKR